MHDGIDRWEAKRRVSGDMRDGRRQGGELRTESGGSTVSYEVLGGTRSLRTNEMGKTGILYRRWRRL